LKEKYCVRRVWKEMLEEQEMRGRRAGARG
jgi:hypothetical protein